VVLGQLRVHEKSNEITAIPELLEAIFIENSLVSIDAMGCQTEIAKKIIDKKGDYLLAVKENQKGLHHDLLDSFRFLKTEEALTDIDTGHGRVEKRKCSIVKDLSHISEVDKWKNL